MYKILLVDDEPPCLQDLKSEILSATKCFTIETACSGKMALIKIQKDKPDVVFCDITMPGMDGISLISEIKRISSDTINIIVSGYQKFEYARNAIQLDVYEYILKPVEPESIQRVISKIQADLQIKYHDKCKEQLYRLLNGLSVDGEFVNKCINSKSFLLITARTGLLPSNLNFMKLKNTELLSMISVVMKECCTESDRCWVLEGRDFHEIIVILGFQQYMQMKNKLLLQKMYQALVKNHQGITIVHSPMIQMEELSGSLEEILKIMDTRVTLGKSQIIGPVGKNSGLVGHIDTADSKIEENILMGIKSKPGNDILEFLDDYFKYLEDNDTPQYILGKKLRKIYGVIKERILIQGTELTKNEEEAIDMLIYDAKSFDILAHHFKKMLDLLLKDSIQSVNMHKKTYQLFNSIKEYIIENYAGRFTLQDVCELFCVSQPYVSRLFQKYENMSFNDYLTKARIEKAKDIIHKNPHISLLEIAEMVGYSDSHYFSNVFKKITGIRPTDYKEK